MQPTDWIMFSIHGSTRYAGAWCAPRADWYVSNYLALSHSAATVTSGSWDKYARADGGAWLGPNPYGFENSFGTNCSAKGFGWCSERRLGGRYLYFMPGATGQDEVYAWGYSNAAPYTLEIRVGPSFEAVCNAPSCGDGLQNQDETGVDCGGVCGPCLP